MFVFQAKFICNDDDDREVRSKTFKAALRVESRHEANLVRTVS